MSHFAKTKWLLGIDEVGRGPLAGPITLGGVLVKRSNFLKVIPNKLKDSKKLTSDERVSHLRNFHKLRKDGKLSFAVSSVSNLKIDSHGLTWSVNFAIANLLKKLNCDPRNISVLLDGKLYAPKDFIYQQTFIRGDERFPIIAMASIVAKVHRDRYMTRLSALYPEYGFESHKGYGTRAHYAAIKKFGLSPIHRKTFLGP
ncbi:MAG: hypothetical protein A3D64_03325 [Candidatus Wildermuthbacteria bacterium RIFCSPHIGHO2_02_FULL_49_9]|uniref:Ribonuclease n=1 Tax=Candidatus Wildermuthbacteria bacterium RIFCSPHIGHO2_02_FULL_49_9 TaxID=1802456 RepID=A0A1G2RDY6_9BACT|nr:MAG: hypothetical protein A3D64_03325 [Candidatus Wildermuthbacteria bacterium RIFCSPHIGHO2_02_FULL_49_9]